MLFKMVMLIVKVLFVVAVLKASSLLDRVVLGICQCKTTVNWNGTDLDDSQNRKLLFPALQFMASLTIADYNGDFSIPIKLVAGVHKEAKNC